MLLTLSVISSQGAALGRSAYRVFDAQGGTIGRVDANDWVLPDPAKFVSSHHARIRCQNNVFYLQDISTNGTFLNSTDAPVSKTDLTALGDGDRILIGDYEILVQLIDDGSAAAPEPPAPAPMPTSMPAPMLTPMPAMPAPISAPISAPMSVPMTPPTPAAWPISAADASLMGDETPETSDPLLLLGGGAVPRAPAPRAEPFAPPPPPPLTRQPSAPLVPPAPLIAPAAPAEPDGIPDDWQLTGFNIPSSAPALAPAPAAAPAPAPRPRAPERSVTAQAPLPTPPAPRQPAPAPNTLAATLPSGPRPAPASTAPVRTPAPGAMDERFVALFNGLGVDPDRVSPETFAELGEIIRVVVQGLIDVLQSRTEVKNNFRVPMTTMRPVENNPLKFSLNVDDAIHNLFVKRNPGYLQPVDAFREGFRDVAYHQVAMLAGIRSAFNALYARFEPTGLEERYERKLKRTGLLGMANKLKYWDLYRELFEEYDKDAEATFQNLFGEDFAKAYFEQLQKLATTARARKR